MTMIYDCFLYYDEDALLEMRLNTLEHVVDRFVIVESLYTFTGKRRCKLNFDIEKFARFRGKIIYVVNDIAPVFYQHAFQSNSSLVKAGETDPWENESTARNQIMQGLAGAQDDDIIIVSDVDEIPRPEAIKAFSHRHLCTTLHQQYFNFKFNVRVLNNDGTPRCATLAKMVTFKTLRTFSWDNRNYCATLSAVEHPYARAGGAGNGSAGERKSLRMEDGIFHG